MKTIIATESRPNYYKGQLLQAEDFLAEQNFHVDARLRHNRILHHWGIVRGLAVSHKGENIIIIHPGVAIDISGHEIELAEPIDIVITHSVPNAVLNVGLAYEEAASSEAEAGGERNRRDSRAMVVVVEDSQESEGVTLALVRLDGHGRIGKDALDFSRTKYASVVAPGSITHQDLHESLRKGWLRLPFRPVPLPDPLEGEEEPPPSFRVGATEARSPHIKSGETDKGAAGTMAFPLPPNIRHVRRFRIAGSLNKGGISIKLHTGGWDPVEKKHIHREILVKQITSAPFDETFTIEGHGCILDPESQTLSIWLRGVQKTSVSLVAVELEY